MINALFNALKNNNKREEGKEGEEGKEALIMKLVNIRNNKEQTALMIAEESGGEHSDAMIKAINREDFLGPPNNVKSQLTAESVPPPGAIA